MGTFSIFTLFPSCACLIMQGMYICSTHHLIFYLLHRSSVVYMAQAEFWLLYLTYSGLCRKGYNHLIYHEICISSFNNSRYNNKMLISYIVTCITMYLHRVFFMTMWPIKIDFWVMQVATLMLSSVVSILHNIADATDEKKANSASEVYSCHVSPIMTNCSQHHISYS